MRYLPVLLLLAACSSSSADDSAPACTIVGTYKVVGTKQTGDCPDGSETSYTVSRDGADYFLEVPGVQGGCPLEAIEECKLQTKCDLAVLDATDPNNAVGGISLSMDFTGAGFTATSTIVLPPGKSLENGCRGTYTLTGTRL